MGRNNQLYIGKDVRSILCGAGHAASRNVMRGVGRAEMHVYPRAPIVFANGNHVIDITSPGDAFRTLPTLMITIDESNTCWWRHRSPRVSLGAEHPSHTSS